MKSLQRRLDRVERLIRRGEPPDDSRGHRAFSEHALACLAALPGCLPPLPPAAAAWLKRQRPVSRAEALAALAGMGSTQEGVIPAGEDG